MFDKLSNSNFDKNSSENSNNIKNLEDTKILNEKFKLKINNEVFENIAEIELVKSNLRRVWERVYDFDQDLVFMKQN